MCDSPTTDSSPPPPSQAELCGPPAPGLAPRPHASPQAPTGHAWVPSGRAPHGLSGTVAQSGQERCGVRPGAQGTRGEPLTGPGEAHATASTMCVSGECSHWALPSKPSTFKKLSPSPDPIRKNTICRGREC